MMGKDHERARHAIAEQMIAGLEEGESRWLEAHLEECPDCSAYSESAHRAAGELRMAVAMPEPSLVRATQRSARLYAARLGEAESHRRMLVVSVFLAAIWGVLLQPYVWRLTGWLGSVLNVPDPAWQAAFLAMWLVPGIVVVLVLIHRPTGVRTAEEGRPVTGPRGVRHEL